MQNILNCNFYFQYFGLSEKSFEFSLTNMKPKGVEISNFTQQPTFLVAKSTLNLQKKIRWF